MRYVGFLACVASVLASAHAQDSPGPIPPASRAEIVAAVKRAAAGKGPADPLAAAPPLLRAQVGTFGRITGTPRVQKVIDPTTATARVILPVTDPKNAGKGPAPAIVLVFEGLDTSNLADGAAAPIPGVWFIAGNRQVAGATHFRAVRFVPTPAELAAIAGAP